MDISEFSNQDFSEVEWINKTFIASESTSKEVFVTSLVSKLQLYVQQVNSSIEDTSQQILSEISQVVGEVQLLQISARNVKSSITEVEKEIAKVQDDTGDGLQRLEYLDGLKTKLQNAKQGLQESDSWGALTLELDDLLERNDISRACEKLTALQASLVAQRNLPGQVERGQQVEDFKNRLEAIASIPVVQNFTSGNLEESKKFVKIFQDMERGEQLTQYYRTVQKTNLQRHWIEVVEQHENSNSGRFFRDFYDHLYDNFQKQYKWCIQVFGTPKQAVLTLTELLNTMQPTRESVIIAALKRSNEKLLLLTEVSGANLYFGDMIQRTEPNEDLAHSIFNYFGTFIGQYAAIEQTVIGTSLAELSLSQGAPMESVRGLSNANAKVIQWAEASIKRCTDITQNCAVAPLVSILNAYFKGFLEKYRKTQKQIKASKSLEQDWNMLQVCISLMQSVGELKGSINKLEQMIETIILEVDSRSATFSYKIPRKEQKELNRLAVQVKEKPSSIFGAVMEVLVPLCGEIHDTLLSIIFAPVEEHLKQVTAKDRFDQSGSPDLPDYSFVPLEYITQVGQYILTLPQHLEPVLLTPSASLRTALELSDEKYVQGEHIADILLALIAEECCALYQEQIAALNGLSNSAAKQLATDIEYLGSVLEELGLSLGSQLQQVVALLRAPAENYLTVGAGCDARLVTKIKQIRQIATIE